MRQGTYGGGQFFHECFLKASWDRKTVHRTLSGWPFDDPVWNDVSALEFCDTTTVAIIESSGETDPSTTVAGEVTPTPSTSEGPVKKVSTANNYHFVIYHGVYLNGGCVYQMLTQFWNLNNEQDPCFRVQDVLIQYIGVPVL